MNFVALTGWLVNDPEEGWTQNRRRHLSFDLNIETQSGHALYVAVRSFAASGSLGLKAGDKITVMGGLRHTPRTGFFVSAHIIALIPDQESPGRDLWQVAVSGTVPLED